MRKLIVTLAVASIFVTAVPAHAHAATALLQAGNLIFQGLYSLGLPGALANTIANLALPALALGAAVGGMRKGKGDNE